MKKQRLAKRLICWILSFVLVLAMAPAVFAAETLFDISGSTMTLGNTLEINFVIDTANLEDADNYAEISIDYADSRGTVKTQIPQSQWKAYDGSSKYVSYCVCAKEMMDQLSVAVYNAEGKQLSEVYTDSVAGYAYRVLDKSSNEELKVLAVDMLNYGAAAQTKFNYNTDDMANAELTDEQKALATVVTRKENKQVKGTGLAGSTLTLEENILLNFVYENATIDQAAYARISFTDHYGEAKNYTVEADQFTEYDSTKKYVQVDTLVVADSRELVTVELIDAEGKVLSTSADSVESYTARANTQLFDNILAFGDGAYNYFHTSAPEQGGNIIELSASVSTENGKVTQSATIGEEGISAQIPAGVQVESNTLTLTVSEKESSDSGVALEAGQEILPLDIHIEGVSENNATPIQVCLGKILPNGLNIGNVTLYHVENGVANAMTQVMTLAELDAHNEFYYDPATGDITVAMASFSEVAMVSDEENAWNGEIDTSWYTKNPNAEEFEIFNADQLAGLGKLVDGGNTFDGKTVKMCLNIDLHGTKDGKTLSFDPIGYDYEFNGGKVFKGTFDGNGNTISNLYQDGWALGLSYSTAGGGLFASAVDAEFKNLTLDNAYVVMECIDMGTLVGYAYGTCKFENIIVSNSTIANYNRYTGGVIGEVQGNHTLINVDVDANTVVSALWGTFDPGIGGIIGGKYGETKIYMEACDVACELDVYNDVTSAYQWYSYRRAGMLIGDSEESKNVNGRTEATATYLTTKDCTVSYGDWVNYHYCEFGTTNNSGYRYPFVRSEAGLFNEAYSNPRYGHPGDKDGNLISAEHDESAHVEGEAHELLIVFNQLYGGGQGCYGGNSHLDNGVTVIDAPNVAEKFTGKGITSVAPDTLVTLGDLFEESGLGSDIQDFYVHAYVSPIDENTTARGTFNRNQNDWTQSTLKFTGEGIVTVTINDYYFCTPTTIYITVGEEQVPVDKFQTKAAENLTFCQKTVSLDKIFEAVDGVEIDDANITVTVTKDGVALENVVEKNTSDWTQSTITFDGTTTGDYTVTITDNNLCNVCEATVTLENTVKFTTKFTGDFLYRVGNVGSVSLGTMFEQASTYTGEIGTVSVDVKTIAGNASGSYTSNSAWENGTVLFSGTGVVELTITDNDYCIATTLKLEVVDATNATSAANATTKNIVLLKDSGFSSLEVSNGYTLYGNGFTLTCGSDSAVADMGYAFVTLDSGTLDNVQIICPNFDYAVLYKSNLTDGSNRNETDASGKTRYYNAKSGVAVSGNSQILNSRISGARAAVNAASGNLLIENSSIELGAVANILVGAANKVTLRDVTLVQKPTASTYDSSKTLMGFSVLFVCDANGDAAPMTLEGELIQHAWIDEGDSQYVPSAGKSIINTVLAKTEYLHDLDSNGENESLNLGFAYMPESLTSKVNATTITDNRNNKADVPYDYAEVSILSGKTYVYSYKNTNGTDPSFTKDPSYVPNKYSDNIIVTYSDTVEGLTSGKSFGTDGWVYELNVDLDKASGYALDFSKLSMSVNGVPVNDFLVDGSAKPTSPAAVVAGGTTYVLTATVEGVEYTAAFKVTGTETSKDSPSLVAANYEAGLCVASSKGGTWHGAAPVLEGIQIRYWSVAEKQYKTIDLADYTPTGTGKQNGTNNFWTYTPANGDFILTITNTAYVQTSKQVYAMPVVVQDITDNNSKLFFVPSNTNGLVNTGNSARTIAIGYSFKDNNNGEELKFSNTWSIEEDKENPYKYSDFCNGTMAEFSSGGSSSGTCLAGGTLITLADGTKRAVEDLRKGDSVMSYDHVTGQIVSSDVIIVVRTSSEHYLNTFVFDDGTELTTINEHGIYDLDLAKYVNIDHENADEFIGHNFVSVDVTGNIGTKKLVDVVSEYQTGYKYDIVTNQTLNYVAEDTLSITHVLVDVANTFEFDSNMMYDQEKMQADIEAYGLYTYDEWEEYADISVFEQYNIPVMKVGISKGLYTKEYIIGLINTYVLDDNVQIVDLDEI